jgi:drug/metabolite transporter (DMT)-like permease
VSASLNAVAFFLYNRALKITDLSLVVPIITLSPLFMFLTSPLILGEFGHWSDLGGSSLIVMGSYILNWDARGGGYLAPLGALWQKPGPRQMLGVTLIWSFTSNIDKIGIQSSSIAFWLFSLYGTIALILLGVALQQGSSVRLGKPQALGLTSIGLLNVCGILLQMQALHLTLVMRVISVKRLSTLMGVLLGVMFLQESGLRHRLLGAALMVMGVALLL